jgi:DNA polymerase-3 subunit beta
MTIGTEPPVSTALSIACSRDDLVRLLGLTARAVSTRTSVQILAGILLEVNGGLLTVSATDMEMSVRATLPGAGVSDGAVVVPGRLLLDIVRLLPAGDVRIHQESGAATLELEGGSASYRLNTFRADDFPRLPVIEREALVAMPKVSLVETIGRVSRAASRDESRPVLTGILVQVQGNSLIMAATDSYRLAVKETTLTTAVEAPLEAIVPARALSELSRIAQSESGDDVLVGLSENQVIFGVNDVWLTARRIDGQFPNFRQLRPDGFEAEVTLSRDELADAVKRVAVMAARNAPLRLRVEEGQLSIQVQSQDVGEARESMPISYTGDALEIGFNPEFLREGVESITGDQVRLQLITPLRPGLLSGDSDDFWYLIMPIRLTG